MSLFQVAILRDHDYNTMQEMLDLEICHYVELNRHLQQHQLLYNDTLRRAEEVQKKITFIENIYADFQVKLRAPQDVARLKQATERILNQSGLRSSGLLAKIEQDINSQAEFMKQQNTLLQNSFSQYRKQIARIKFLEQVSQICEKEKPTGADLEAKVLQNQNQVQDSLLQNDTLVESSVKVMGGTVPKAEVQMLKKLLFRATRGRALLSTFALEIDSTDQMNAYDFGFDNNLGYIILFEESLNIGRIVMKICSSFQADLFETTISGCHQELQQAIEQKESSRKLIAESRAMFISVLKNFNPLDDEDAVSLLMVYKQCVAKDQIIYRTLNMFKECKTFLVGMFWVPTKVKSGIQEKLAHMKQKLDAAPFIVEREPDQELTPPTYFRDCEFTSAAQQIIDEYEVPGYKEVNPALFTVISFPFLFGVMFGDVFAGGMLLAGGLYLCCRSYGPNDSMAGVKRFRHFFLMMGFFAFFCGIIYNDFTSVGMYLFGESCWEMPEGSGAATLKQDCMYPIGVDPSWYMATNEILFINSVKMKLAIILGVMQMTLGIILKGCNDAYHRRFVDFTFEFLPQLVMFMALFGFLSYLVVAKWLTDYTDDTSRAPGIIILMLDMAFFKKEPSEPSFAPIIGTLEEQQHIMSIMMYIVLACVPLMLCVKPIFLLAGKKKKDPKVEEEFEHAGSFNTGDDNYLNAGEEGKVLKVKDDAFNLKENVIASYADEHHHDDSAGEIYIHQSIEVIEFVLGTISNTASYLRLWALSLAHSQLAKVFYDRTLLAGFTSNSWIMLFITFFVFFGATVGVLMIMDVMECFLHTLRLHWVEFMSKFYKGEGIKFEPTTIKGALVQPVKTA